MHHSPCAMMKDRPYEVDQNYQGPYLGAAVSWNHESPWKYADVARLGWWKGGAEPIARSAYIVNVRLFLGHLFGCHGP